MRVAGARQCLSLMQNLRGATRVCLFPLMFARPEASAKAAGGASDSVQISGVRGAKSESARTGRALSADCSGLRTSAVRAVPCDPRNVRPGDADIGQFAVAELVELAQAGVVAPPGLEEVEIATNMIFAFLFPDVSRGILVGAKIRFHAASQQSLCCGAAMQKMHGSSHCFFTKIKRFAAPRGRPQGYPVLAH